MDRNKLKILNLIMDMWDDYLIKNNGVGDFEGWCNGNVDNEEQRELIDKVKYHVDAITYLML